jgi:3-dehydro-L-gulonate-6-phosphate decarboxylase
LGCSFKDNKHNQQKGFREMSKIPMLQFALDFITLPPAIAVASKTAPHVDIFEIGTPLCKAAGLDAIRAVREVCPNNLILADFKTPDVGWLEAKMAFDAGADLMTVIGGAPMATVESALKTANEYGKEILMELTGVRDIIARATEWRQVGIEWMVYHRGWDEEASNRQWSQNDLDTIQRLIDMGFKVTVTGGITLESIPFFQSIPVTAIITGRAIHAAKDPVASAMEIRSTISRLWSRPNPVSAAGKTGASEFQRAAKAIRWGVSEMDLLLTTDGTDCPGCDAPGHFCNGTHTAIFAPDGVNVNELVKGIERIFGPSRAFGRVDHNSFYLDPAQLTDFSEAKVVQLLTAAGNALAGLGHRVDLNSGIAAANQVLVN